MRGLVILTVGSQAFALAKRVMIILVAQIVITGMVTLRKEGYLLQVSNLESRDDGRMPLVSPIRKVRKDLEVGSANYQLRSVSLGGRIANNKPRSFFF